MKLLYATSLRFPSNRANRIQVLSMAEAFTRLLGDRFTLGIEVNRDRMPIAANVVEWGTGIRSWELARRAYAYARKNQFTHIYCREEKLLFFLTLHALFDRRAPKIWYEAHELKYAHRAWFRFAIRRAAGVAPLTQPLADVLRERTGITCPIVVAADGVDPALFDIPLTKEAAREQLGLPQDKTIVLYSGSLDPWKGVGTLHESAKYLDASYEIVVVGGKPHYIDEFHETYPPRDGIRMVGEKPYATEFPVYLRAADIAILPNSGNDEISRICTSPLKLFAYMAGNRPIVSSDLPSLRDVLNEKNAVLVPPDDPKALAEGIKRLRQDPGLARALAGQAYEDAKLYTWDARAARIVNAIGVVHAPRRKIGMVLDPYGEKYAGGLGRAIRAYAEALLAADTRDSFVVYVKGNPRELQLPGARTPRFLGTLPLWLFGGFGMDRSLSAHLFFTPVIPLFFRPRNAVVIVHDFAYRRLPANSLRQQFERFIITRVHARSLRLASVVVAVSEETKADAIRYYRVPEEKIRVIYDGFMPLTEESKPIDVPQPYFLFAGVLKPRKNIAATIHAFALFCKEDAVHSLVIAGKKSGDYYEQLVKLTESLGITDRVKFVGYVSDAELSYLYRNAVALVFATTLEGFGMPILEAMSCGCPVITSDHGAQAEVAGGAACLVDPENPADIMRGFRDLTVDPDLRMQLVVKGYARAKEFSWEHAAREIGSLLVE